MVNINKADISYKANIKSVCENTLKRKQNGTYFGNETKNGLRMAIAYIDSIAGESLTESELKHAVRLTTYRGAETDYSRLRTL